MANCSNGLRLWADNAVIMIVALLPRLGFFLTGKAPFSQDAEDYPDAAADLINHGYIMDPDVMPGYPVLRLIFGEHVLYLDIVLSSLTAVVGAALARIIFKSRAAGLFAGAAIALHLNLALYAGSGLTEPSSTFLFALGVLFLYRKQVLLAVPIVVASLLIRPSMFMLTPVLFIFIAFIVNREKPINLAKYSLYAVVVFCLMFAPWWVHNYHRYGSFVPLNLGGPYTLYVGNNPNAKTGEGLGGIDVLAEERFTKIDSIVERREAMGAAAIEWIRENPGRFLELSLKRFALFWHVEENSSVTVWMLIQPYHLAFLLFLIFGWRRHFVSGTPLVLAIGYLCAVHSVLVSAPRYQFQVTPFIALLGFGWIAVEGEKRWIAIRSRRRCRANFH